ncbi:MAG: hypothetical protein M3R13_06840 [Armatimonadota bacterium]|nr:hypothetical protein [Armatimonadota bacterium]
MNWLDWIGGWLNREAEFPFLERYIEEEVRRSTDVGIGVGGFMLSMAALLACWMLGAISNWSVPIILGPIAAAATAFGLHRMTQNRVHPAQRELDKTRKSLRGFMHQLRSWKNMRMLRFKLQGGLGEIMEVGARCWLQTRYGLDDVLNGHREDPLYDTCAKVMRAMDVGMTKLVGVAKDSSESGLFLHPAYEAGRTVAEHMVALSREAEKLAVKHQTAEDRSTISATDELRAALDECRGLDEAHQELDRIHQEASRR